MMRNKNSKDPSPIEKQKAQAEYALASFLAFVRMGRETPIAPTEETSYEAEQAALDLEELLTSQGMLPQDALAKLNQRIDDYNQNADADARFPQFTTLGTGKVPIVDQIRAFQAFFHHFSPQYLTPLEFESDTFDEVQSSLEELLQKIENGSVSLNEGIQKLVEIINHVNHMVPIRYPELDIYAYRSS